MMQQHLTNEIASGLADKLDAQMILVEMNGIHLCEVTRGTERKSTTTTRATVSEPKDIEIDQLQTAVNQTGNRK